MQPNAVFELMNPLERSKFIQARIDLEAREQFLKGGSYQACFDEMAGNYTRALTKNLANNWFFKVILPGFEESKTVTGEDKDVVAGGCWFELVDVFERTLVVWIVTVEEAYRGIGLGHAMLNVAENLAKTNLCTNIELQCEPSNEIALNLYAKHGFKPLSLALIKRLPKAS